MHFCQCPIMPHGILTSVYVSVPHLLTPFISLSNTRIQDNTKNMNMSRENVAVQYEAPVWSQNSIRTVKLGVFWVWSENWVFLLCCRLLPTQTWDNSLWELFAAQYYPEYCCIYLCVGVLYKGNIWSIVWPGYTCGRGGWQSICPPSTVFASGNRHLCYCLKFYYMWYMTQSQML